MIAVETENDKLERVRKLLAKAEKAGTPEEAEIYNDKAAELMARHSIDSAMLVADRPDRDRIEMRRIQMEDPYSREKATLAGGVAMAMNCRIMSHPAPGSSRIESVSLVGFVSDLDRVELTYTSLLLQAGRAVEQQRPAAWSGESTTAFRRTWLIGFTAEVHRRFTEVAARAVSDHDAAKPSGKASAEVVLADRKALVDRALTERFPTMRKPRKRRLTGSGYHSGVAAGRRADLGQKRVGTHRRELGPGQP